LADVSGRYGGHLTIGQRSEPKTLNPVTATDAVSREVIGRLNGDLIEINRASQLTEPALAKSWNISADGRTFTLQLRKGVRFSDGYPFDADDVIFSFNVYMDAAVDSPQRDLLIIDGKPIAVTKLDQYTVRFVLPRPYAAAERLFDGLAILPKHLLEKPYHEGHFAQAWPLNVSAPKLQDWGRSGSSNMCLGSASFSNAILITGKWIARISDCLTWTNWSFCLWARKTRK